MISVEQLRSQLPFLEADLLQEILDKSQEVTIPGQQQIVREGQYIKTVPIVINGLLKVIKGKGEKDLLLYYIKPGDSCIMSFAFGLSNEPSNVSAFTETETTLLLLQADDIRKWLTLFPSLNKLFLDLYNDRYHDLIDTISVLTYEKLDQRLWQYLQNRARVLKTKDLHITHREIANDLASSREVISRLLKRLESEGFISSGHDGIKILV